MSAPEPAPSTELLVFVPPADPPVEIHRVDDALDLVFLIQPAGDALVALLDAERRVVLVVETGPANLPAVASFATEFEAVEAAVVCTASKVGSCAPEDSLLEWHRLRARFGSNGVDLLDWLHIDDLLVRSLAETASEGSPWA